MKQEKVATVLRLYLDSDMSAKPSKRSDFGKPTKHSKIYTLEMLHDRNEKPAEQEDSNDRHPQDDEYSPDQAPVIDTWTLCSGNFSLLFGGGVFYTTLFLLNFLNIHF